MNRFVLWEMGWESEKRSTGGLWRVRVRIMDGWYVNGWQREVGGICHPTLRFSHEPEEFGAEKNIRMRYGQLRALKGGRVSGGKV
ncbi:hypothetical protein ZHAS_00018724 [Anopheles sinensis]|uniref:Uncharacterized protein n=1 Tax=Anopheles sinensis TaxID=74873 RepID=A0A084WKE2_ANOSI|nr:hypothetical protein ZHAS_00018724 [Anopheles sinensis]